MDSKTTQVPPPSPTVQEKPQVVQASTTTTQSTDPPSQSQKKKPKSLITVVLVIILFLLATSSTLAYLIAYEKIPLKRYPNIQKSVIHTVQAIPFMPKTPRFLLAKTAEIHSKVTKQSFDISAAIDSSDITSLLGLNFNDIKATGKVDYSNPNNINGLVNLSVSKDFNFDLMKKDQMIYFKVNKFSDLLLPLLGVDKDKVSPLMSKWVAYDISPLETEARELLEQNAEDEQNINIFESTIENYINDSILKSMVVTKVEEDGTNLHKIELVADDNLIDYLGRKLIQNAPGNSSYLYDAGGQAQINLSDIIKNMSMQIFIDKNFYTRKITLSLELQYDEANYGGVPGVRFPFYGDSTSKLAIVTKFGNFNEEVALDTLTETTPLEEFISELTQTINLATGSATLEK